MSAKIPLRTDYDAVQARALARKATDPNQVRRLLAIAAVYDGMNRRDAAAVGGMDRQSLRDWVYRFNQAGPEGLHDHKSPGAVPQLSERLKSVLCEDALTMAIRNRRPPMGLIHHSDRGSQGGFNRSSQHSGIGGCYDGTQTAVGSVWTEQVAFARSTGLGTA